MDSSASTNAWMTGWTAQDPLQIQYNYVGHDEGEWFPSDRAGLEYRDLGLLAATGGLMGAQQLRFAGDSQEDDNGWRCHKLDFQWFYVLRGQVSIETEDGEHLTLKSGDAAYQPPLWRYREYDFSDEFEVLEITGPAKVETFQGRDAQLGAHARNSSSRATYLFDGPDAYSRGDGPRSYFEYRDFGTRVSTEGRIHIHTVRAATEPMMGGTGEHYHNMSQWVMPIQGWADVSVDGQPDRRMVADDFMCISRGLRHNVTAYSADYATLEMCVPAEYDTITTGLDKVRDPRSSDRPSLD